MEIFIITSFEEFRHHNLFQPVTLPKRKKLVEAVNVRNVK